MSGKRYTRYVWCILSVLLALGGLLGFASTVRGDGDDFDHFVYLPMILRDYIPGCVPLENAYVTGTVITAVPGEEVHLNVAYDPVSATRPISYTWPSGGLVSGQGTSSTIYSWSEVGEYTGVVTLTNCRGTAVVTAAYGVYVTGPPVGSVYPPNCAEGVPLNTVVAITFTEDIVTGTETYTAIEAYHAFRVLGQGFYDTVSGTLKLEGPTLLFTPTILLSDTSYVLVVNEGIRDVTGTTGLQVAAVAVPTCCEEFAPDHAYYYFSTGVSDTARASHPVSGTRNILLAEVAYDVDSARRLTITELYEVITTAVERAAVHYTTTNMLTGCTESAAAQFISPFHFWPNIIDITAVYTQDNALYKKILDDLLARETITRAQELRADLDREIAAGDRVFLARDFVTEVTYKFQPFYEVGYALIINLDERYYTEILIHCYGDSGLPVLHDPHTEELGAMFADSTTVPQGEVWDLCFRGNFRKRRYDALPVDKLEEDPGWVFFIERVAMDCDCMSCLHDESFDPTPPDVPWNPWNPIPPPWLVPKPPKKPNGDPPVPPVFTPGAAVNPWPFLFPELIPPYDGTEESSEGDPGECDPDELAAIAAKMAALQAQLAELQQQRANDLKTFNGSSSEHTYGSRYKWTPGASFHDPCLQDLFEGYNGQIGALQAEVDALEQQISDLYAQSKANEKALDPVIKTLLRRGDFWSNMLEVNDERWAGGSVPCRPPWIPGGGSTLENGSGNSVIIIGVEEQAKFQRALAKALMGDHKFDEEGNIHPVPGLNFEKALQGAIDSPEVNAFTNAWGQRVIAKSGDKVLAMIWRTYGECLKRLYANMLDKFLPAVFGDLTAAQLEQMKRVMFEGESALTAAQKAELVQYEKDQEALQEQMSQLRTQANTKRKEIDRLRDEFRKKALACFTASFEKIRRLEQKIWIFQAFMIWCEDPSLKKAYPIYVAHHKDRFCAVLREMLASTDYGPSFKAYVQMLLDHNCSPSGGSCSVEE